LVASNDQVDHLRRVLRFEDGAEVTYTDGTGTFGEGTWSNGTVTRGSEQPKSRPSDLVIAVAPPSNRHRVRFLVEKLAEIGVESLIWLATSHGVRRLPALKKQQSWAVSALQQSRGSWLMQVDDRFAGWNDLERPLAVCVPGGSGSESGFRTAVVGPEGGFDSDEIPDDAVGVSLGSTILRVETAAVVAASKFR
jgi:16S rRNA (uracil1498-N3)-methyltransferase